MNYDNGSIHKRQNITFKDTKKLDFRMGGHPVAITFKVTFDHDHIYCLTLSSQAHRYSSDPNRYFLLKKDGVNRLKENSIVDLKCIYKEKNINIPETGMMHDTDYMKMIKKLIEYQTTKHTDEFFEEVLPFIT